MSALGHKRTSTTTGLRQMRRPQERASTLMGDNPRRYGFNDSLDELPPCNAACEIGPTLWLLQPQDEPPQGTMRKRRFVYPAVYPSAFFPIRSGRKISISHCAAGTNEIAADPLSALPPKADVDRQFWNVR
jgi:hypothetical protein